MGDDFISDEPVNDDATGWLRPDGRAWFCHRMNHDEVACDLARRYGWRPPWVVGANDKNPKRLDANQWLVERGWIRMSGLFGSVQWMAETPERITAEQRNTLSRLGYDPDRPIKRSG